MTAFVKYGRKCKATTLVVENISVPRNAPTKERTILQPKDLKILFSCDETIKYGKPVYELYVNAYRFEVATGLRPGEVIGLLKSDISAGKVTIRRSINRFAEQTNGKNQNALRSFSLTPLAAEILQLQEFKLEQLGIESEYIFPDKYGAAIKQGVYYKHWVRYRDSNGISEASPYELRHTFVSVVKRLPEGLLKAVVGHSKDMDTYGTYGHELDGEMEDTARLIQQQFISILGDD